MHIGIFCYVIISDKVIYNLQIFLCHVLIVFSPCKLYCRCGSFVGEKFVNGRRGGILCRVVLIAAFLADKLTVERMLNFFGRIAAYFALFPMSFAVGKPFAVSVVVGYGYYCVLPVNFRPALGVGKKFMAYRTRPVCNYALVLAGGGSSLRLFKRMPLCRDCHRRKDGLAISVLVRKEFSAVRTFPVRPVAFLRAGGVLCRVRYKSMLLRLPVSAIIARILGIVLISAATCHTDHARKSHGGCHNQCSQLSFHNFLRYIKIKKRALQTKTRPAQYPRLLAQNFPYNGK